MPEDTEDTNAPQPDPEPEPAPPPPDVIDLAALERARLQEALGSQTPAGPPAQRGPAEHALPERAPSEPMPSNPTAPLWSTDDAGRRHHDAGGPPLPPGATRPLDDPRVAHLPGPSGPPTGAPGPSGEQAEAPTYLEGEPTTRLLCASMHLQASFAAHVADTLLNGSMQAPAPVWGLDPVALVRHARVSSKLWAERDRKLRVVLPAAGVTLALTLWLFLFESLPWQLTLILLVGTPAAGFGYAWSLIYRHYRDARARALGVMDPRLPAREWAAVDADGPVLAPDEQERLEGLARANVVVAGGGWPFVGDGPKLNSWTLTVDLEKGTPSKDGGRLVPASVAPLELHRYLLTAVPQLAPSQVHAQHRLYVRGPAASTVPGLLPVPLGPSPQPAPRVDPRTVDQFAVKPTPAARSYVVFQRILWGGQIVPTVIVRAERQRNTLFIEASENILPPLRSTFHDVTLLPKDGGRVRRDLIFSSFHATRRQTVRAWGRWFEGRRAAKADAEAGAQVLADFAHGMPVNHGKPTSLREDVSDVARLNYFGIAEETLAVVALRRRVFESLEAYLDAHDVDVTDLKQQMNLIALSVPVSLVDRAAGSATLGSNVAG